MRQMALATLILAMTPALGLPDNLTNGVVWGLLTGAGLGVGVVAVHTSHAGYGDYLVNSAAFGGIGMGVGVLIDALHKGQNVVYSQPSGPQSTSLLRSFNIAPRVSRGQKGAALSLSF